MTRTVRAAVAAIVLCVLCACSTSTYRGDSPCASQPGGKACEIDRYLRAP